jgi:hypothetical protein
VVSKPVNQLIVHSIVQSLLRGQIHTASDLDELIDRQALEKQASEQPAIAKQGMGNNAHPGN